MFCICCKKNNVKPSNYSGTTQSEEERLWQNEGSTIDNEMINDGIIQIIEAGYGSIHDGDQFIIAICDQCIKDNLEDATLLYFGNYMIRELNGEVEKSKKLFRRRNNLDDLT